MRSLLTRLAVVASATLTLTAAVAVVTPVASYARDGVRAGFSIHHEDGSTGSWIGSYEADGKTVYCIDPNKTGPSTAGGYGPAKSVHSLKDIAGHAVPTRDVQRAAYVASKFGKTSNDVQAAAVDTVIYALLGRGRFAVGGTRSEERMHDTGHYDAIKAQVRKMMAQSQKFAGKPDLSFSVSKSHGLGKPVTVTVRLKSQYGAALPGVTVHADYPFDDAGAKTARTNSDGVAKMSFTPTHVGTGSMKASATHLPTTFPSIRFPAVASAQRMIVTGLFMNVETKATPVTVSKATVEVTTQTSAAVVTPGSSLTDKVKVTAPSGYDVTVDAYLFGPYATKPRRDSCYDAKQFGHTTLHVTGSGTFTTPPVGPLTQPGYYTWVEVGPATDSAQAFRTKCGIASETSRVTKYTPAFVTAVNDQTVHVGDNILDHVTVTGLAASHPLTINWTLYGPFAHHPTATSCKADRKAASGTVVANADGTVDTAPFTVKQPGYYTYVENSATTSWYHGAATGCGETTETTNATKYTPVVVTQTSAQEASTGVSLHDTVTVTGLPDGVKATVVAYLFGPSVSEAGIVCTNPDKTRKVVFTINGSGTYQTPALTINNPGWYGWQEHIVGTPQVNTGTTKCKVPSETTIVTRPKAPPVKIDTGPSATATPHAPTPTDGPTPAWLPLTGLLLAAAAGIGSITIRRRIHA